MARNTINGGAELKLKKRKLRLERVRCNFVCEMEFHIISIVLLHRIMEVDGTLRDCWVQYLPLGNRTADDTEQREVKTLIKRNKTKLAFLPICLKDSSVMFH